MAKPITANARPPTPRFSTQTEKLSACWVTALFHGPANAKMTDAISIKAIPLTLPPPWLPSVATSTPPKPSAQPSSLARGHPVGLAVQKVRQITPIKLWVLFKMPPCAGQQRHGGVVEEYCAAVCHRPSPQAEASVLPCGIGSGRRFSARPASQTSAAPIIKRTPARHKIDAVSAESIANRR